MATLDTDQLADLRMDLGLTNNMQIVRLTGNPTGGTFTLSYEGTASGAIAYNASAETVQTALQAVSTLGTSDDVQVTGADGGPWKVTIAGDDVAILVGSSSLTGGSSPSVSVVSPMHFSDESLHRFYTRAGGTSSDEDATRVYALRALWARFAKHHDYLVGLSAKDRQEIFNNVEKLLDRWERITGMSGGTIQVGTLDYGIDTPYEALEE